MGQALYRLVILDFAMVVMAILLFDFPLKLVAYLLASVAPSLITWLIIIIIIIIIVIIVIIIITTIQRYNLVVFAGTFSSAFGDEA